MNNNLSIFNYKKVETFKKIQLFKKITVFIILLFTIFNINLLSVSAKTLETSRTVSLDLACNKTGYEFSVYQVGTLVNNTNPNSTKYNSLVPEIESSILNGDTATILSTLDDIATLPATAKKVGVLDSTLETKKTIDNLKQGIYYIKATNYPAGIKSIQNSVVALPYYNGSNWIYEVNEINLATKVIDGTPTTKKEITNSTKNNVNYTDVNLGDVINFEIKSTTAGSKSMKLASYVVSDDMSKGLTLNNDSFNLSLLNDKGEKLSTLSPSDYTINITKQIDGENTLFNVSLTESFLNKDSFYEEEVYYTSLTYTATLNKHAVVGKDGNPNEEQHLAYSNKNGVTSKIKGNTVYIYTYAIKIDKINDKGEPLPDAEFSLYRTKEDAENNANVTAKGVSDANGLVKFFNDKDEEMKLQSGTYFVVETKAPKYHNLHTNVIEIIIDVTYGDVFIDGTYVISCPTDGYASAMIKNFKIPLPITGFNSNSITFIIGLVLVIIATTLFIVRRKIQKKNIEST